MNKYCIFLAMIILSFLIFSAKCSQMVLSTHNRPNISIPLLKQHSQTCQLVSYVVPNKLLSINITKIDQHAVMTRITLSNNFMNFIKEIKVEQNMAFLTVDFTESINTNNSEEVTTKITVRYIDGKNQELFQEERKVYLLFPIAEKVHYDVILPTWAILITQLVGLIFIFILPLNIQYRQFLPLTYNIITCSLYIILLIISLYLSIFWDGLYQIQRIIVAVVSFACAVIYIQDLLLYVFEERKVVFGFSICLSLVLILSDEICPFLEGSWILNNMIALLFAGAFIKFIIIRKIKTAIWALALMWFFSCIRQSAIFLGWQEFDQGMGIKILPLFLQFPANFFDHQDAYVCSAFGSSKIVSFGLILNYCKRLDLYLSTNFYKTLGYLVTTICVGAELLFNLLSDEIPTMQVMSVIIYYPVIVLLMLFFANKRGEWAQVWHGSFYDMAVNRASIPREISFQHLANSFGDNLIINSRSIENDT